MTELITCSTIEFKEKFWIFESESQILIINILYDNTILKCDKLCNELLDAEGFKK